MLNDIGINENLANNLFTDLELNKTELERLIKSNMDEKLNQILNNNEMDKNVNNKIPSKSKNQNNNNMNAFNQMNDNLFNNQQEIQENINKESINSTTQEKDKLPQNYNLSLSRYIELKSHFDVIRKLGYLPNINSLISVSEVL